jgi:hypothetical protein
LFRGLAGLDTSSRDLQKLLTYGMTKLANQDDIVFGVDRYNDDTVVMLNNIPGGSPAAGLFDSV